MWTIEYYSERVQHEIYNLPTSVGVRYIRLTDMLIEFGPNLGMPHTRAMGDGLFELRISGKEGIARVFYCTAIRQRIIMLHSFVKKTEKTPKRELEIARRRQKEVKAW
jgi:phage-related protein